MPDKIRVLIADDDEIVSTGILATLQTDSVLQEILHIDLESRFIEKVLDRVAKGDYHLLILDLDWFNDQGAGLHALQTLLKTRPNLYIITISNFPDLVDQSREAGAHIARPKGFRRHELIDLIHNALNYLNQNGHLH